MLKTFDLSSGSLACRRLTVVDRDVAFVSNVSLEIDLFSLYIDQVVIPGADNTIIPSHLSSPYSFELLQYFRIFNFL